MVTSCSVISRAIGIGGWYGVNGVGYLIAKTRVLNAAEQDDI